MIASAHYPAIVVDGLARTLCPALVNLGVLPALPNKGRGQQGGMCTACFVGKETRDWGGRIVGGKGRYRCEGC